MPVRDGLERAAPASAAQARSPACPGSASGYAYIAPFFVVFLAFSLYPWLDTAWVSLHDVRLTDVRPADLGRTGQLPRPVHEQVLLERVPQHHHHRHHLDRPSAVHGTGDRAPAELPDAGPHVLPGRDADAVRHQPGRSDGDLPPALRQGPRHHQLGPAALVHLPPVDWQGSKWPSQIAVSVDRHLALDRLQRTDLPGGHAGHRHVAVRGRSDRRCVALAAVPPRHAARAAADDPVHDRRVDHRRDPAVRRAAALSTRRASPTAAPRTSTRRWGC